MRLLVSLLLLVHGCIHLLGFRAPWNPDELAALGWLAACALLVAAALLHLASARQWWVPAAVGLSVSQAMVVLHWQSAWAGTLMNVLVAATVVVGLAMARFERRVDREIDALLAGVPARAEAPLTLEALAGLPEPVQRWLRRSGVVGRPPTRTVRLQQTGTMRMAPGAAGMPVEAEQYFDVSAPGFVWAVETRLLGVIPIIGRDNLSRGKGHLLITAAGLFKVADGRGAGIDQGTLLRFLAEIVWFPSAALAPYIVWQPIDAQRARATISVGGLSAQATFSFDAEGRFTDLGAQRFCSMTGQLERWEIPARAWKTFDGVEVPSQGGAVWKLKTGDLDYYQWRITRLELDRRRRFAEDANEKTRPTFVNRASYGSTQ